MTRYFFVHLQKTAGTALLRRLRHHFGDDHVYPLRGEQGTPEAVLDVDLMARRVTEEGDRFRVVTGHYPFAAASLLDGEWATFTVLRDPVERVLSFLRHQRDVEPHFASASLEDIYADPISTGPLVANHMVKMLALEPAELAEGALTPVTVDRVRLERALEVLTTRIDVWGLQSDFDGFCRELETRFGWDLGPPLFMNRSSPEPASDALRQQVRADNRFDVELYEAASDLWRTTHAGHQTSGT